MATAKKAPAKKAAAVKKTAPAKKAAAPKKTTSAKTEAKPATVQSAPAPVSTPVRPAPAAKKKRGFFARMLGLS